VCVSLQYSDLIASCFMWHPKSLLISVSQKWPYGFWSCSEFLSASLRNWWSLLACILHFSGI
jgi:hypothetical protein